MKKLFLVLFLFLFIGCDTFYLIPLSKNSPDLNIYFKCGRLNMSLYNWQGHSFDFYQNFQLKDTVTIYKDSLLIYYKDKKYRTTFIKDGKGMLPDKKLKLTGKSSIRTAFYIDRKVDQGDTIKVYPRGYLYCNGEEVEMDSFEVVIQQNLRGPLEK